MATNEQKTAIINLINEFVDGKRNPVSFRYKLAYGSFQANIRKCDEGIWFGCGIFEDGQLMKDMCGKWSELEESKSQHFNLYDKSCTRQDFFQELEDMFDKNVKDYYDRFYPTSNSS